MKRSAKKAIIISLCLMAAGILICAGVFFFSGFDFMKFDNSVYITNTHEISQEIRSININTDIADINILSTPDNSVKLTCYEDESKPHTITAENGLLTIKSAKKHWYDHIKLFSFRTPELTLYLPQDMYDSFIVNTNTGDISTENISATQMELESDTGHIDLQNTDYAELITAESDTGHISISNSNCNKLTAATDTGHVNLANVKAMDIEAETDTGDVCLQNTTSEGNISTEASTGDIIFENSDGRNIYAENSTGDIKGTILTSKTFTAHSSTGKVSVPNSQGTGIFEAETSTGDITISYSITQ